MVLQRFFRHGNGSGCVALARDASAIYERRHQRQSSSRTRIARASSLRLKALKLIAPAL
jgi:hypothetical protein